MIQLIIINLVIIGINILVLFILKKKVKEEKMVKFLFKIASLLTILCHYSSLLYHLIVDGTPLHFLESNPNLILPIYPCNVVMWCCLIYAFDKNDNKFTRFLADYIFLFGFFSALVGMAANVDFINNPTLLNYDVTKGILAHGFMLFNVLLLPTFGKIKIDLNYNIPRILIGIIMMLLVGIYCNVVFLVLSGYDTAYNVNSMFLLHSPFDGLDFLIFPFIAAVAVVVYFFVLWIIEAFKYPKEEQWYKRIKNIKNKNA